MRELIVHLPLSLIFPLKAVLSLIIEQAEKLKHHIHILREGEIDENPGRDTSVAWFASYCIFLLSLGLMITTNDSSVSQECCKWRTLSNTFLPLIATLLPSIACNVTIFVLWAFAYHKHRLLATRHSPRENEAIQDRECRGYQPAIRCSLWHQPDGCYSGADWCTWFGVHALSTSRYGDNDEAMMRSQDTASCCMTPSTSMFLVPNTLLEKQVCRMSSLEDNPPDIRAIYTTHACYKRDDGCNPSFSSVSGSPHTVIISQMSDTTRSGCSRCTWCPPFTCRWQGGVLGPHKGGWDDVLRW